MSAEHTLGTTDLDAQDSIYLMHKSSNNTYVTCDVYRLVTFTYVYRAGHEFIVQMSVRYRSAVSLLQQLQQWRATFVPVTLLGNEPGQRTRYSDSVANPGILFGGGSTNSVEDRGQRERGYGGR